MAFAGKVLTRLWRMAAAATWYGVGIWAALAALFTMPVTFWLAIPIGAVIAGLFVSTRGETFRLWQWFAVPWSQKRRTTAALAVAAAVAVHYFGFVTPDPNQDWAPEQARTSSVRLEGDKIHVTNVRNFTWHSATDFTPGYYDRVYDLNALDTMYYVVASMPGLELVAHVFVCFGFTDGQSIAISVEGRRMKGQSYRLIPSMFRQYQLIYIVGDERDVVGLRGAIWQKPVYFYPARTTAERKRAILLDMLARADKLQSQPEFYHLITNNCMNNITAHLRRLGGRPLPHDLQVLLTGLSDRAAFNLGYIDTDLTFAQARRAFRVDPWMQRTPLDDHFGRRLREAIAEQAAAQREEQ